MTSLKSLTAKPSIQTLSTDRKKTQEKQKVFSLKTERNTKLMTKEISRKYEILLYNIFILTLNSIWAK
jgi:hypothetical protein